MVNYACAFSQSELGKYFELIIIVVNLQARNGGEWYIPWGIIL